VVRMSLWLILGRPGRSSVPSFEPGKLKLEIGSEFGSLGMKGGTDKPLAHPRTTPTRRGRPYQIVNFEY